MPSKETPIVSVKNLTVAYGSHVVLDDITFDIHQGELTALLGPNGSGKSTLIRAILGLIPIQSGEVKVFGKAPKEVLFDIGYLPQRLDFDRTFPITVREFLELAHSPKVNPLAVTDVLKEVGLQGYDSALLGKLSGGQLQRILIARAIINNPKLLILDEPEAGIDVEAERNFYSLIKHLDDEHGMTIILISHEVDLVFDFAEQVICVNKDLVCQGAPSKVLTSKKMGELYGGGIAHHHHRDHDKHGNTDAHDLAKRHQD